MKRGLALIVSLACASIASVASAVTLVPDNGFGTASMPLQAAYTGIGIMQISAGLPAGTTVDMGTVFTAPGATAELAGGSLGGTMSAANGNGFQWQMQGTGTLSTYSRNLFLPLAGGVASFGGAPASSGFEVHSASRINGNPVQSYNTNMFRLFGQITGDPDFDLLRVVAGTDFGLPGPGQTTLVQSGPNWAVNSYYDLTYRIDFVGRAGGTFSGLSGSSTGFIRIVVPEPASLTALVTGGLLSLGRRR